ncbi:hypothetical protein D779_3534 [Imhoffiella purpurea]|uniref:Uncharacterized protein n=1 Tax=Imhoffiella purpurea TaxID=1249627 RepID=W9VC74_9GAMM|nr:hypothetical protein D779_3534 [Imhoffiella purpurea]
MRSRPGIQVWQRTPSPVAREACPRPVARISILRRIHSLPRVRSRMQIAGMGASPTPRRTRLTLRIPTAYTRP